MGRAGAAPRPCRRRVSGRGRVSGRADPEISRLSLKDTLPSLRHSISRRNRASKPISTNSGDIQEVSGPGIAPVGARGRHLRIVVIRGPSAAATDRTQPPQRPGTPLSRGNEPKPAAEPPQRPGTPLSRGNEPKPAAEPPQRPGTPLSRANEPKPAAEPPQRPGTPLSRGHRAAPTNRSPPPSRRRTPLSRRTGPKPAAKRAAESPQRPGTTLSRPRACPRASRRP